MDFDKRHEANHQKPDDDEREKGQPIRRIMVLEHKAAAAARINNAEHILEQFALPAFRAAWLADLSEEGAHKGDDRLILL